MFFINVVNKHRKAMFLLPFHILRKTILGTTILGKPFEENIHFVVGETYHLKIRFSLVCVILGYILHGRFHSCALKKVRK